GQGVRPVGEERLPAPAERPEPAGAAVAGRARGRCRLLKSSCGGGIALNTESDMSYPLRRMAGASLCRKKTGGDRLRA
ncbi:hypothetical protein, partial [Yokenella regensburgei]|uniref:hypothetical protein n=1 Tax=Yokenella regensburgei TaxID=158877 RepID=UPI001ED8EDBC